jgi:hypothetical protein
MYTLYKPVWRDSDAIKLLEENVIIWLYRGNALQVFIAALCANIKYSSDNLKYCRFRKLHRADRPGFGGRLIVIFISNSGW